jgi:hypothetical protein
MKPNTPTPSIAAVTIIRGGVAYRFARNQAIPKWLEKEANIALRNGQATVRFGDSNG